MKNQAIGVFDSGFGGLSIMRQLKEIFPHEDFIYIADTKYVPYGIKTAKEIEGYVTRITNYLVKRNVKAIVIACNTATANANHLTLNVPVIGMIEPTVSEIVKTTKNKNVLVLATPATVKSNLYYDYLSKYQITPLQEPAPELVDLVEAMEIGTSEAFSVVKEKLKPYVNKNLDTIVLGCTHYGFLRKEILSAIPSVNLVDGATEVARLLKEALAANDSLQNNQTGTLEIMTTGEFDKFKEDVESLKIKYDKIIKLDL